MTEEIKSNIKKSQEFLKKKDFNNAELILLKNLEISDKNFETFFLLGTIAGIKKDLIKAETYLKKAESLNSNNENLFLNLAIIQKKINKRNDSIDNFKKVVELNNKNLEGLCGLAQIFEEEGNFNMAKTYFQKVLEIDSNHHIANHSYGKLLLKLNQHIKGLKHIEKVSGIIRFNKDILKII
tara:strand:- start:1069 stop:1614 length:546 start_codon:yes stop_codon:yes gene_type:complete